MDQTHRLSHDPQRLKILLIGEYSNVHNTLAEGLKRLGHHVTVASNGDFWKNYPRDIDLARESGRGAGLNLLFRIFRNLSAFRGYDVVQIINPLFVELKANLNHLLYQYLRKHNRSLFLGAFGMDYFWIRACREHNILRYSDFNIADTLRTDDEAIREIKDWVGTDKEKLNRYIASDCDGIIAGLYEYKVAYDCFYPQKTHFIPFPIRLSKYFASNFRLADAKNTSKPSHKIKMLIGINLARNRYKGTDIMLEAAQHIAHKYPQNVDLKVVYSMPFDEYDRLVGEYDLLLDQLYSYTPAMNALNAMAKGVICVGGGEPEHYGLLGENHLRPILNVLPSRQSVCDCLERIVTHPEQIPILQEQSIKYVQRHHDHLKVARQYVQYWLKQIENRDKNRGR